MNCPCCDFPLPDDARECPECGIAWDKAPEISLDSPAPESAFDRGFGLGFGFALGVIIALLLLCLVVYIYVNYQLAGMS